MGSISNLARAFSTAARHAINTGRGGNGALSAAMQRVGASHQNIETNSNSNNGTVGGNRGGNGATDPAQKALQNHQSKTN